jgi:transposase
LLSITLLIDLKEARERLNQISKNSSMPPSSEAPWDKASNYEDEEKDDESSGDIETIDKETLDFLNRGVNDYCSTLR